jgi:hypothetical protein
LGEHADSNSSSPSRYECDQPIESGFDAIYARAEFLMRLR